MTSLPRVIFWGTPDFAIPSANACLKATNLLAVVTQPDKARGRKQQILPCPVKEWAQQNNVLALSPESIRKNLCSDYEKLMRLIENEKPDFFIVTAFGRIFPSELLAKAKVAALNVHASLLPRWRGAAPVQRCIEAGDNLTGVCLQKMVEELDAGDIILEQKTDVRAGEGSRLLFQRLSLFGETILLDFFNHFKTGPVILEGKKQDPSGITYAHKIEKAEGFFKSTWGAKELVNRVRAFDVWPGVRACVYFKTQKLSFPEFILIEETGEQIAEIRSKDSVRAGEIFLENQKSYLKCADFFVEIKKIKVPGKSQTPAFLFFKNLYAQTGHESLKLDNL